MKELVRHIQEEWKAAKQAAQERCMSMGDREMARKLAECDMFKGTEDLEGLVELIFSPRGIEFLTNSAFLTWRHSGSSSSTVPNVSACT